MTRGERFKAAVLERYEQSTPAEAELLEEAARLLDLADELAEAVDTTGFMSIGSAGQPVANPLLNALQAARAELRQVLRHLDLPNPEREE